MPDIIGGARRGLNGFDIIHLHSYRSFANVVTHHYAKKYRVPYVLDAHGSAPRMTAGKRGFKWLLKWLFDIAFGYRILRDASRVIAETEVGINEYRELGVKEDKIVLITPPLPVEEFANLPAQGLFRQKYDIKAKHVVMFLGRINWIKGLDFLAESFYELARHRSDVILVIVGSDDGYKPTLERVIEKLKLSDRVLFTGFLRGKDKLSALVDADVVVQTSRYEQGAWAPLEAVLCGTPIIVSSNSGAGEDVRRIDAGYLVEWGNKSDLVDKVKYVLDNPDQAAIKTRKARDYLERNQSMSSRIREYEELYARCIKEKGGRR
jgi:glycosyltransferase involved in cell wall biosynthesis